MAADRQADVVLQRGVPGDGQGGEHDHGVRQSGRGGRGLSPSSSCWGTVSIATRCRCCASRAGATTNTTARCRSSRWASCRRICRGCWSARLTFIYHYFASVPFIILATAQGLRYLERRNRALQPCADGRARRGRRGAVHRVLSLCVGAGGLPRVAGADELV